MAAPLISKAFAHNATSGSKTTITTGAIDTTGADFLLLCVSSYNGYAITPSDSKSNTWQSRTMYGTTTSFVQIFYCYNPSSVGSGHTFTATFATADYSSVFAYAFSGMDITSSVYDTENGAAAYATGNITPAESGELLVSVYNQYHSELEITENPSGGWDVEDSDPYLGSFTPGGAVAFINTYDSTDAIQCNWDLTQSTGEGEAAAIAAFKLAAGGETVQIGKSNELYSGQSLNINAREVIQIAQASQLLVGQPLTVNMRELINIVQSTLLYTAQSVNVNIKQLVNILQGSINYAGRPFTTSGDEIVSIVQAALLYTGQSVGVNIKQTVQIDKASLLYTGQDYLIHETYIPGIGTVSYNGLSLRVVSVTGYTEDIGFGHHGHGLAMD